MPKPTPIAARRGPDHLDEIAGLLAVAYLRLRAKRATANTSGQKDADKSAVRLDGTGQSERSWARTISGPKEDVHDTLT